MERQPELQRHISCAPPQPDAPQEPEPDQTRQCPPRDLPRDSAPRDDVSASDAATLAHDPDRLVLEPAERRLRGRHSVVLNSNCAIRDGAASRPR